MTNPGWGPFLFDTIAESWFARLTEPGPAKWWVEYLRRQPVHVSSITVFERIRGYSMLWHAADKVRRAAIETARLAYLDAARRVWSVDAAMAVIAGENTALIPEPPTPPKYTQRPHLTHKRFVQIGTRSLTSC